MRRRAVRLLAVVAVVTGATAGCGKQERRPAAEVAPRAAVGDLAFDRDVLVLTIPHGGRGTARVSLAGSRRAEARLIPRGTPHPSMRVGVSGEALVVEVGGSTENLPVGTHVGNLLVDTGLPQPATLTLPYSIRVTGTLSVSPTNPTFDLHDPDGRARTIVVRSTAAQAEAFQLRAAEVTAGPFDAAIEKAGPGVFHVRVRVRAKDLPRDDRGVLGRLQLRSNDAAEPVKELPLFAYGRWRDAGSR